MQNFHLFGHDFHPVFLVGALVLLAAACGYVKRRLPRTPRGW